MLQALAAEREKRECKRLFRVRSEAAARSSRNGQVSFFKLLRQLLDLCQQMFVRRHEAPKIFESSRAVITYIQVYIINLQVIASRIRKTKNSQGVRIYTHALSSFFFHFWPSVMRYNRRVRYLFGLSIYSVTNYSFLVVILTSTW